MVIISNCRELQQNKIRKSNHGKEEKTIAKYNEYYYLIKKIVLDWLKDPKFIT